MNLHPLLGSFRGESPSKFNQIRKCLGGLQFVYGRPNNFATYTYSPSVYPNEHDVAGLQSRVVLTISTQQIVVHVYARDHSTSAPHLDIAKCAVVAGATCSIERSEERTNARDSVISRKANL